MNMPFMFFVIVLMLVFGRHIILIFVAIGAVSEVIFGTGVFGVNVIGNLTSIISTFGESGFAGLVALLVLVGLFRK